MAHSEPATDALLAELESLAPRITAGRQAQARMREIVAELRGLDVPQDDIVKASGQERKQVQRWEQQAGFPPRPRGGTRGESREGHSHEE